MAKATIKQVADFFRTGNPERDSLSAFRKEWEALSTDEKAYFADAVGETL